ncbi:MAG: hypothetical protein PVJ09_00365 [Candidatus Woesebacteria bacterium]|jgi:hypothetical protein
MIRERIGQARATSPEGEFKLEDLCYMARELDSVVWTAKDFPRQHRPDVRALVPGIRIRDFDRLGSPLELHPRIKKQFKMNTLRTLKASSAVFVFKKIAYYDPQTRQIFIRPMALSFQKQRLQRILAHEFSADNSDRLMIIQPGNYTDFQRKKIRPLLEILFTKKHRPRMAQTHIEKTGYRETLFQGQFAISDIYPREVIELSEIYHCLMELISMQLFQRNGDVKAFDLDIQSGRLQSLGVMEYPRFEDIAYKAFRVINWRTLLDAFKTEDIFETLAILETSSSRYGKGVCNELIRASRLDEGNVLAQNKMFFDL